MTENIFFICVVGLYFFFGASFGQFFGGTINWRKIKGQVRFTYRITWKKGKGPCGTGCSISDVGNATRAGIPFNNIHWKCTNGCPAGTFGGDMNYVLTAIGDDPEWEQGETSFRYTYAGNNVFKFMLDNIQWIPTNNTSVPSPVYMDTTVDIRERNDTNNSNSSPMAALPPYLNVPHECFSKLQLPVKDPDEDVIKCRFALPSECGTSCTNLPDAYIDKSSCTIALNATTERGYSADDIYRVTIVVEDFPPWPINVGNELKMPSQSLSRIPLQFTIRIINSTSCQNTTKYISPTPDDGTRFAFFMITQNFISVFYIETPDVNHTEFLVSAPAGMKYKMLSDDMHRANVTRIYQTWKVDRDKMGDNLVCVWGKEPSELMTPRRCIDAMILDMDDCRTSPCKRGGTCVDLFHSYICKCPPGLKQPHCEQKITCSDHPCYNNGTCVNSSSPYTCVCPPGFTGNHCQNEINYCMSFPCRNGGKCHYGNTPGRYHCTCATGFGGPRCEKAISNKTCGGSCMQYSNIDINSVTAVSPLFWLILTSVLGSLLLLALLIGCYFCLRYACARIGPDTKDKNEEKWAERRKPLECGHNFKSRRLPDKGVHTKSKNSWNLEF